MFGPTGTVKGFVRWRSWRASRNSGEEREEGGDGAQSEGLCPCTRMHAPALCQATRVDAIRSPRAAACWWKGTGSAAGCRTPSAHGIACSRWSLAVPPHLPHQEIVPISSLARQRRKREVARSQGAAPRTPQLPPAPISSRRRQGGVVPTEHAYTALIDACVKRGELSRAEKVPHRASQGWGGGGGYGEGGGRGREGRSQGAREGARE